MIRPSKTIGENYLERWHLIPKNRYFNIYLHKFSGSDDERAMHDHPWSSVSILLSGKLGEWFDNNGVLAWRVIRRWRVVYRPATHAHRLVIFRGTPTWTLFITGPKVREWGFHCRNGWQHWTTMATEDGRMIGGV